MQQYFVKLQQTLTHCSSSLGLHPAVYFYSTKGRYQPTPLMAWIEIIKYFKDKNLMNQATMNPTLTGARSVQAKRKFPTRKDHNYFINESNPLTYRLTKINKDAVSQSDYILQFFLY